MKVDTASTYASRAAIRAKSTNYIPASMTL